MDNYILLADSDQEILKLQVTALGYFYGGSVQLATTPQEAIEILKVRGRPELLLADLDLIAAGNGILHQVLEENQEIFPVIASSLAENASELVQDWPCVSGVLEKPLSVDAFTYLVKGMITSPACSPSHVPISIQTVLGFRQLNFDLYLKLSGTNFVKIYRKEDPFTEADASRFLEKGIVDLHLLASDAYELLRSWEELLKNKGLDGASGEGTKAFTFALDTLETVERLSRCLGWTSEVLRSAQATIDHAVTILEKDSNLAEVLREKLASPHSRFSNHVGLLCFLTCAFSNLIESSVESAPLKLTLASLLHDLSVDEELYEDLREWNSRASNLKDRSPEVMKYRLHPIEAAKISLALEGIPSDVEKIILQHHEVLDGRGFPRGLVSTRITQLSSLFIMMENLVDFIGDGANLETSLKDYLTWANAYYDRGHFKNILMGINVRLQNL